MTQNRLHLHELKLAELEEIFQQTFSNHPDYQTIKAGYEFAKAAHGKQMRDGLDSMAYIQHPLRIIILMFSEFDISDTDLILAALLHDVLEDTDVETATLEKEFGPKVAELVGALTRPRSADENNHPNAKFQAKKEKFLEQMKASKEVRLLKVLDLIDNMQDWQYLPEQSALLKKLPRWLHEAELFYLPLAETVGPVYVNKMKSVISEMEGRGYAAKSSDFEM